MKLNMLKLKCYSHQQLHQFSLGSTIRFGKNIFNIDTNGTIGNIHVLGNLFKT